MSDERTTPGTDPVNLDKPATSRFRLSNGRAVDGSPMPEPPKFIRYAVIAMMVSAVGALIASLTLYGERDWLLRSFTTANDKLKGKKNYRQPDSLPDLVSSTLTQDLIKTVLVIIALGLAARAVWRGRYWSRWAVIGLWVLATFTASFAGFIYVLAVIVTSEPLAFRVPAFISATAMIVAVVLVTLRPSVTYLNLTRPIKAGGAPPRRGGLMGGRMPRQSYGTPASSKSAAATAPAQPGPERARAKQRAAVDSAAKGADLARARAKASKSRRTGV